MFELKVQKIGDSLGLILPNEVLKHLNCGEGETVVLVEDPAGNYRLTHPESNFERTMAAAKDIMNRYDGALRELAK